MLSSSPCHKVMRRYAGRSSKCKSVIAVNGQFLRQALWPLTLREDLMEVFHEQLIDFLPLEKLAVRDRPRRDQPAQESIWVRTKTSRRFL